MRLPFTVEQFLEVFATYNIAIWPTQIVAYAAGLATVVAAVRGGRAASTIVPALLALAWAFVGIAYHWTWFAPVNPVARVFAVLFVGHAALLVDAAVRKRVAFDGWRSASVVLGAVVLAYVFLGYPLLGAVRGHAYPRAPMFGVTPCPLAIFTFGIMLLASRPVPMRLLVVPLVWAVIGTSAALQLGMTEDLGLPVGGLLATIALWRRRAITRSRAELAS